MTDAKKMRLRFYGGSTQAQKGELYLSLQPEARQVEIAHVAGRICRRSCVARRQLGKTLRVLRLPFFRALQFGKFCRNLNRRRHQVRQRRDVLLFQRLLHFADVRIVRIENLADFVLLLPSRRERKHHQPCQNHRENPRRQSVCFHRKLLKIKYIACRPARL